MVLCVGYKLFFECGISVVFVVLFLVQYLEHYVLEVTYLRFV